MNRTNRGLTLLEVVIGSAIMAVVFAIGYAIVFSTAQLSESEMALRDRQLQLQGAEDLLASEIRESSGPLIRVAAFTDAQMPSPNQAVLVFPSARDASNVFQVSNATISWQKIVVYAPYYDAVLQTGTIRRYEVTPAPTYFTDIAQNPTITVTATTLDLNGTIIQRSDGQRLALRVDYFKITQAGSRISIDMSLQGSAFVKQMNVDLQSGAVGRN